MTTVPALGEIVGLVKDLPSLPVVVAELLACSAQEDLDLQALADKIALDQALTAKTLRLANSSFYGMQSQVTSMRQAIAVLGFRSVRMLVAACAITGSLRLPAASRFDFQRFWRHSVGTAVVARALAPHLRFDPESAFIAGLLHDLGALVLATTVPEASAAVEAYRLEHDCTTAEAERAMLGFDHALVGAALAAHWKFPLEIQCAVAAHHEAADCLAALPLLVHAANIFAHALDFSGADDDLVPPLSERVWTALDLSDAACLRVFREAEDSFSGMCSILLG